MQALALVGYAAPPRWAGANVLSLDGGGIRGIIAIEILRHLERLTGRKVHELFDYIIGVSTGAIIAAVVGGGVGSLGEARRMYRTLSRDMFGNTSRIGGASRLVWTHSYYDTQAWEKMLRDNLKDCTLAHCNRNDMPKVSARSASVKVSAATGAPERARIDYRILRRKRRSLRLSYHGLRVRVGVDREDVGVCNAACVSVDSWR